MIFPSLVVLITFLFQLTLSLHLRVSIPQLPKHKTSYLLSKQDAILNKVQNIISNFPQVTDMNSTNTIDNQIQLFEQSILQKKSIINDILLSLSLNISDIECLGPVLNDQQQQQFGQVVQAVTNNTKSLIELLQQLPESTNVNKDQLNSKIIFVQNTTQAINSISQSNCQNYQYQDKEQSITNLLSPNWYAGNATLQKLQQIATSNYNYTVCPLQTPFWNGTRCINCGKQYFNIFARNCTECFLFNVSSRSCLQKNIFGINQETGIEKILMPLGIALQEINAKLRDQYKQFNISNCPQDQPFYDGNNCINCEYGFYFSVSDKKCVKCPQKYAYNLFSKKCQIAGSLMTWFGENPLNNISGWLPPIKISDFTVDNFLLPENVTIDDLNKQQQKLTKSEFKVQICSKQLPFFNGKNCSSCSNKGQVYSLLLHRCTFCPQQFSFNKQWKKCTSGYSNWSQIQYSAPQNLPGLYLTNLSAIKNSILVPIDTTYEQLLEKQQNYIVLSNYKLCPQIKPVFLYRQCSICPKSYQYSFSDQKCVQCPQNFTFDSNKMRCIFGKQTWTGTKTLKAGRVPAKYITNLNEAKRLVTPQNVSIEDLKQYYEQQNYVYSLLLCPKEKPYYNTIECINCAQEQVFSYTDLRCIQCPDNFQYNFVNHKCENLQTWTGQYPATTNQAVFQLIQQYS